MTDFRGIRVRKAWGFERQLLVHDDVALWHLHLLPNQRTSLHCHAAKKTGLVVLGGRARVQFLGDYEVDGDGRYLRAGQSAMIRPTVFHATQNASWNEPLDLLEVETPADKFDLIRLEDDHGRAGQGYEGAEAYEPDLDGGWVGGSLLLGCCRLTVFQPNGFLSAREGKLIFLSGGVRAANAQVVGPGDVVDAAVLRRLSEKFTALPSTVLEVVPM